MADFLYGDKCEILSDLTNSLSIRDKISNPRPSVSQIDTVLTEQSNPQLLKVES